LEWFFKVWQIIAQQAVVQCCGFAVIAFVRLSLMKEVVGKPNSGEHVLKREENTWSGVIQMLFVLGNHGHGKECENIDWIYW